MSDRRAVVVVLGALAALLGVAMALLPLLELGDPMVPSGETGARVDLTSTLIGTMVVGALLVVAGVGTVVALVGAQLRAARD